MNPLQPQPDQSAMSHHIDVSAIDPNVLRSDMKSSKIVEEYFDAGAKQQPGI